MYAQTHLIYAFAGLSSKYEMKAFDPYNDIKQGKTKDTIALWGEKVSTESAYWQLLFSDCKGNFQKFVGLKKYNSQLKTMIAIGGWNEGSKRWQL